MRPREQAYAHHRPHESRGASSRFGGAELRWEAAPSRPSPGRRTRMRAGAHARPAAWPPRAGAPQRARAVRPLEGGLLGPQVCLQLRPIGEPLPEPRMLASRAPRPAFDAQAPRSLSRLRSCNRSVKCPAWSLLLHLVCPGDRALNERAGGAISDDAPAPGMLTCSADDRPGLPEYPRATLRNTSGPNPIQGRCGGASPWPANFSRGRRPTISNRRRTWGERSFVSSSARSRWAN